MCGQALPARTLAIYERDTKTVRCLDCDPSVGTATQLEPRSGADSEVVKVPVLAPGTAGASARREFERRKAKREERIRAEHPKLGGLILALSDDPQSTTAWERGAVGEERVGARLESLASDDFVVLHDRGIPGTRANIDHIVVSRSGVWVIDPKRYTGRPELRIEGGILRPRVEKLLVGRRDRTKLVDGVLKQVDLVRERVGDVPVTGVLCFVEADWPLIGGSFTTRGVHVMWPKRLMKLLSEQPEGEVDVADVSAKVASHFRPA